MTDNMFYRFYLSLVAHYIFQKTDNLNEMMDRIRFSVDIMKELIEKVKIKEIKRKETEKREVCRSFVLFKRCNFSNNCMFLHTKDPEIIKLTICKFGVECRKVGCVFGHESQIEDNIISDDNCGICWENIYTSKKIFGLLSCCEHKFCISCIRKHRQNTDLPKKNRNACPLCRVASYGYCSSKIFLTGNAKKNEFIKSEKNRAKVLCRDGINCVNRMCGFKHIIG